LWVGIYPDQVMEGTDNERGKSMLFKAVTIDRTGAIVKEVSPHGNLVNRTIFLPPGTLLNVYGYVQSFDTRLIVCNKGISKGLFTVLLNDCLPEEEA